MPQRREILAGSQGRSWTFALCHLCGRNAAGKPVGMRCDFMRRGGREVPIVRSVVAPPGTGLRLGTEAESGCHRLS
jgi:hypothetical protein